MDIVTIGTIMIILIGAAAAGFVLLLSRHRYYESEYYQKTSRTFMQTMAKKEYRSARRLSLVLDKLAFDHEIIYHCPVPHVGDRGIAIDCIILSSKGIYVIANENYSGKISGDEKHSEWRVNKRGRNFYFENPIKKNHVRISALSRFLDIPERSCKSIIAFHGRAALKHIRVKSPRTFVTRARDLEIYFNSEKNKPDILPQSDIYSYYGELRPLTRQMDNVLSQES